MRHKLYNAISDYQDSVQLKGLIELDPTYEKINLKGTKHGKSKSLRGINHHKICIVTAIDSKSSLESFNIDPCMIPDIIPGDQFKSPNGHTLSSVNQLHQSLSELIRVKHGVSTRHLQGYLDWLVFTKELHYKTESRR